MGEKHSEKYILIQKIEAAIQEGHYARAESYINQMKTERWGLPIRAQELLLKVKKKKVEMLCEKAERACKCREYSVITELLIQARNIADGNKDIIQRINDTVKFINILRDSQASAHENHGHIEIKVSPEIFLFKGCIFKNNTAYLHYLSHGYVKINCQTGAYSETDDITQDVPKCVTTERGTTLEGFVNCIVVFYQIVSGNNGFSSVENVLNSFPYQANNAFREYNLKMEMTRKSLTFTHNGRPVSLEDVAHILVDDPQPEKRKQTKKLSIVEEWPVIKYYMQQEVSDNYGFVIPADTTNFSATTYICPECGNHISKVLLPKDTVIALTGGKRMKIDKAFACKHCNNFFAPFSNGRLDSGIIAYLKVNDSRFKEIVQMMDDNYRLPDSY